MNERVAALTRELYEKALSIERERDALRGLVGEVLAWVDNNVKIDWLNWSDRASNIAEEESGVQ